MNAPGSGALAGTLVAVAALGSAGCLTAAGLESWRGRGVRRRTRGLLPEAEAATGTEAKLSAVRRIADRIGRCGGELGHRRVCEMGAALGVGAFAVVVVGGVAGWLLAGAGAWGVTRWIRRREATGSGAERGAARAEAEELPLAAELLAACLAAGSSPAQAADAVGRSVCGPLGARLIRTSIELRLGAEPATAWGHFASLPGSEAFVAAMARAGTVGVPAVDQVTRLTGELRARRGREASARARRAAVLVTGPLGLCFLPAFLAVGVAPVVMGLADSLL